MDSLRLPHLLNSQILLCVAKVFLACSQLEKFVNDITFFSFFFVSFYIRLFWSYQGFIKNKSQSLKKFIIWFSIIVSIYLIEN